MPRVLLLLRLRLPLYLARQACVDAQSWYTWTKAQNFMPALSWGYCHHGTYMHTMLLLLLLLCQVLVCPTGGAASSSWPPSTAMHATCCWARCVWGEGGRIAAVLERMKHGWIKWQPAKLKTITSSVVALQKQLCPMAVPVCQLLLRGGYEGRL
jgi:hypothetical protein